MIGDGLAEKRDDHRTLDQYLKHHVPDAECWIYAARQKDFVLQHNLLCLRVMPKRSNEVLVHIDYVSMEVTMGMKEKPVVKNVLGH